jgi:hypothetical protein
MSKKRTSLDSIVTKMVEDAKPPERPPVPEPASQAEVGNRPGIKQQTAYLKEPVYEQLRRLAFEERHKMHDYIIEGLNLVFRSRGLPSVDELEKKGA